MSPKEVSICDGDRVTMNFTSDSPIEIHGHDLEREVEPGERTELSLRQPARHRLSVFYCSRRCRSAAKG